MIDYLRIMIDAQKAKMDERGASAVEYGLLIAGIAALIVAVVFVFGGALERHLLRHLLLGHARARPLPPAADPQRSPSGRGPRGPRPSAFSAAEATLESPPITRRSTPCPTS